MTTRVIAYVPRFIAVLLIIGSSWLITGCQQSKPHIALGDVGPFPGFEGATGWINSQPLTKESLKGKVVLVDFWTYSCINCLRSLPYVKAWRDKYQAMGLVVVGVHTPEFDFERERVNVELRMKKLGITYPVVMDNDMSIWNSFRNQYWPAHYFIDAKGRIRYHHFGEGKYAESERVIQQLLEEAGVKHASSMGIVQIAARGAMAASTSPASKLSPETYLGTQRAKNFASPEKLVVGGPRTYTEPASLNADSWALSGSWKVTPQDVQLSSTPGAISYVFRGRDLHLVLGNLNERKPVRFRITIDDKAPGENAGTDVAADGTGLVNDYRLYQLVRLKNGSGTHTFRIEFLDPGVRVYAFTFG